MIKASLPKPLRQKLEDTANRVLRTNSGARVLHNILLVGAYTQINEDFGMERDPVTGIPLLYSTDADYYGDMAQILADHTVVLSPDADIRVSNPVLDLSEDFLKATYEADFVGFSNVYYNPDEVRAQREQNPSVSLVTETFGQGKTLEQFVQEFQMVALALDPEEIDINRTQSLLAAEGDPGDPANIWHRKLVESGAVAAINVREVYNYPGHIERSLPTALLDHAPFQKRGSFEGQAHGRIYDLLLR